MGGDRYKELYDSWRWRKVRRYQLRLQPLCAQCEREGRLTVATIVHHTQQHHGDRTKFFMSPLMSLCAPCHDGVMQRIEKKGYDTAIGNDGFPLDVKKHPFYRGKLR
jgi:hypothetical protein